MTIEMTAAKIGRSTKKCEKRMGLGPAAGGGVSWRGGRAGSGSIVPSLGVTLAPGPGAEQAVDDDPVVRARGHGARSAGRRAGSGRGG